jgi:putative glutamine amidotransferase
MSHLPRIGITISAPKHLGWYANYFDRVREQGGEPIAIDPTLAPEEVIDRLDGLLLSGGADVTPTYYGESPHSTVQSRLDLDAMELPLAQLGIERGVPLLAICRGHQLLNVACGGRLVQHIESGQHESHADEPGDNSSWHSVRIDPQSYLGKLVGKNELRVNSRHHQGVREEMVAPGLVPTAWSDDGLIEGLERPDSKSFLVSVQWHPERPEIQPLFNSAFAPLFEEFIKASGKQR